MGKLTVILIVLLIAVITAMIVLIYYNCNQRCDRKIIAPSTPDAPCHIIYDDNEFPKPPSMSSQARIVLPPKRRPPLNKSATSNDITKSSTSVRSDGVPLFTIREYGPEYQI